MCLPQPGVVNLVLGVVKPDFGTRKKGRTRQVWGLRLGSTCTTVTLPEVFLFLSLWFWVGETLLSKLSPAPIVVGGETPKRRCRWVGPPAASRRRVVGRLAVEDDAGRLQCLSNWRVSCCADVRADGCVVRNVLLVAFVPSPSLQCEDCLLRLQRGFDGSCAPANTAGPTSHPPNPDPAAPRA